MDWNESVTTRKLPIETEDVCADKRDASSRLGRTTRLVTLYG